MKRKNLNAIPYSVLTIMGCIAFLSTLTRIYLVGGGFNFKEIYLYGFYWYIFTTIFEYIFVKDMLRFDFEYTVGKKLKDLKFSDSPSILWAIFIISLMTIIYGLFSWLNIIVCLLMWIKPNEKTKS